METQRKIYKDSEILKLYREEGKQEDAFKILVLQYQERLYMHIRKIVIDHDDTDDVLQNTFIKAWNGLLSFRKDSSIYTWLYKIATNEALTLLRRKNRRKIFSVLDAENQLNNILDNDPYFDENDLQMKLQKALLQLPTKQRIVFNMRYFDEMKYEEIARILETSVGALKASYHHATKKIEKYIKNY